MASRSHSACPVPTDAWLVGIDVGGSGSRLCLERADGSDRRRIDGPRVKIGPGGSDADEAVYQLIDSACTAWPDAMKAAAGLGIGATGLASLVSDPSRLVTNVRARLGAAAAAAVDALTAHLGALNGRGGAVVVLGTGAIAMGHPGPDRQGMWNPVWRRVDGWGHLLGDRGSGAWLGRRSLELALQAHDGVSRAGTEFLEAAVRRFGDPADWPAQIYTRDDRAGVLAECAQDVVELAENNVSAAKELLFEAGQQAARSAVATLGEEDPQQVVIAGGLAAAHQLIATGFSTEVSQIRPEVTVVPAVETPLGGALVLARLAAEGTIVAQEKILWT